MDYIEVLLRIEPESTGTEIMIARLSQIGYESFMESENGLLAYIPASDFKVPDLISLQQLREGNIPFNYSYQLVKSQNWNEVWESNFNPVLIAEKVFVRAPFHKVNKSVKYEIIIEPKMSFGTAHHETTAMMIELMLQEDLRHRTVLDMGCGTGILSILAEMLGAEKILAIDIDQWAYNNAAENVKKNNCRKISVVMGNAGYLTNEKFDCILANINRNILLENMEIYSLHLASGGTMILSGFYSADLKAIENSATSFGLNPDKTMMKMDWTAAVFRKPL
jgi:ribosomal protein L11 methyltransferase